METSFDRGRENTDSRKQEEKKEQKQGRKLPQQLSSAAVRLLKLGAKPEDLSPEQFLELEAVAGNQTVLGLIKGSGKDILLAKIPEESREERPLPENPAEIRWPALTAVPEPETAGSGIRKAWPVESFLPVGRQEGGTDEGI